MGTSTFEMVVGLQHLLAYCVIYSTLNWSQTLATWKASCLLSALSYRRDKKTWNGWPECTVLTPIIVKKCATIALQKNSLKIK